MHLRLHCIIHFLIAVAFGIASLAAHGQTGPAAAATTTIHGHIADQTGALIPGAKVTITTVDGKVAGTATADASGAYSVSGLKIGNYIVTAEYPGFAPFQSQAIPVAAGQSKRVDIAMAIEVEQQSVVVTDDSPTVNVEAAGNANSIVIKDKDLDALSDDPDELSNELSALAGPSAGPNGGQIYIDGFSGGQLPPKSAIREIRINQNPFSAEFDRLGYGRIEILTKPGTDKLHGQFFIQGNDSSFNTGNPFTNSIPSYYSYQFNGTVNGAISKTASFFVSAEQRNTNNVNAWRIFNAVLFQGAEGYVNFPNYGVNLVNQRIRDNASARVDWQLGGKNTLTARFGFWSESEHADLNNGFLPSASTHESNTDYTLQMSDAFVINDHAVNETRFQYERQNENHYPDSTDSTVSVQGDFTGGGYPGQVYRDHATRLEFWNITTLSHGAHAIKFGTRIRDGRDANYTNSNFNGNFVFQTYQAYQNMANGLLAGTPFNQLVSEGYGPTSVTNTTGLPSSLANVFDIALFAQDDWKVNPRLTLSAGLRWEAQTQVSDHNDWAPRVSMAYALDGGGNSKKTKTVLRAGYGLFYDRFQTNNLITVNRFNVQNQLVFIKPVCSSTTSGGSQATSLNQIDVSTCSNTGTGGSSVPVRYEVASNYHSPYTGQAGIGLERQIAAGTSATLTYLHSFGVHQMVTRNANQAVGGIPQTDSGGYLYQYYPEAVFKENQLIASVNARVTKNLSLTGFYTHAIANSDTAGTSGTASNAYDLTQDYGRAAFVSPNMLFAMGNYNGPWGIRFSPFMLAQSGKPYNITLPTDPLNNFFNQRPAYATASTPAANKVVTSFGELDVAPQPGEKLVPVNLGNGPAAFAFNLRVSRSIGLGPKIEGSGLNAAGMGGGPPDGGGGGGRRGGPPGGSLGPGGLGGGGGRGGPGGMFGPTSTGRKYSLNFSVQALNLFNNIAYGQPTGTIVPTPISGTTLNGPGTQFGRSTSLAGGMFSSGGAARRIFVQAVFSF